MAEKQKTNRGAFNVPFDADVRLCICEGCSGDGFYIKWPAGWIVTGKSKYGTKYHEHGLGWWCPNCRLKHEKA